MTSSKRNASSIFHSMHQIPGWKSYLGQWSGQCVPGGLQSISKLLELPSGWLIYNTHGLDDEGWGPVSSFYLDELLSRLVQMDHVAVLPVGKALDTISK